MAASAEYLQRGEALDYVNNTEETIPAGVIVTVGAHIGVTGCDIPPGKIGSLHMVGVFKIAKTDTAAIAMGQTVYFDGTGITGGTAAAAEDAEDTGSSGGVIEAGYAAAPAKAEDTQVLVKLCG